MDGERLRFKAALSFSLNDMSDLTKMDDGCYCLPGTPNFETVDSFAALRTPFCDSENGKVSLVAFQMTVGKKKGIKHDGGLKLFNKFRDLRASDLPKKKYTIRTLAEQRMYFVFVTTSSNACSFKKKVPWTLNAGSENKLEGVRQFVLVVPDSLSLAEWSQ